MSNSLDLCKQTGARESGRAVPPRTYMCREFAYPGEAASATKTLIIRRRQWQGVGKEGALRGDLRQYGSTIADLCILRMHSNPTYLPGHPLTDGTGTKNLRRIAGQSKNLVLDSPFKSSIHSEFANCNLSPSRP